MVRTRAHGRAARRRALVACAAIAVLAGAVSAEAKRAPTLATPKDGAQFDGVPPFSWKHQRGAAQYHFQMAADPRFRSVVDDGSFRTRNTFATLEETLPDGDYYWRVRSLNARENAGGWSRARKVKKLWSTVPQLASPTGGEAIAYPGTPLVLRWNPVRGAYKYRVWIGTDPTLATTLDPVDTGATVYSPQRTLAPGRYYWAVSPIDAQGHRGIRSAVGWFTWTWPTSTTPQVFDLNSDARVFDPAFAWNRVPGAAGYEVEINPSEDFAGGSKVCCSEAVIGTSVSPKETLPNNTYYWRMRAVNVDGEAGQWNYGETFKKTFDDVAPTIPNLHMRDLDATATDVEPGTGVLDMNYPIVEWDPVPGAAAYDIQITPFTGIGCDWSKARSEGWDHRTPSTAWTALAPHSASSPVPGEDVEEGQPFVDSGASWCVRVRAVNDVISEWSYLGGGAAASFRYVAPPAGGLPPDGDATSFRTPSAAYLEPGAGAHTPVAPLFVWQPISGAGSYYVVVAKDAAFTEVLDVALTRLPMYAPRRTYPDETTSYYWAVVPAYGLNGGSFNTQPTQNNPKPFDKRSTPPTRLLPSDGADINQPTVFVWTATEGADDYRIQVATDPSFGDPIDDVTTAATSYTSEETYPVDTVLYWRVRANDADDIGLTWSSVGTFRQRLPVPNLFGDNPTGGSTIPVLRWNPVAGAVSYDVHVQQSDGTEKNFNDLRSTAFTAARWYGTGVWRWQVRANFPSGGSSEVNGGYTSRKSFTRHIARPKKLRKVSRHRRVLLSWKGVTGAQHYRVEISDTNSFRFADERIVTDHTIWAPTLTDSDLVDGGRFFWRVAAVDEGGNIGGWRNSKLRIR